MQRINWIDWAKALAVCTVVFCHLPQSQEWFYYRYLQAVIIVIFFFLSGHLKKDRGSDKENWKRYWYGLIIPYFIYNAILYPYWLLKYYLTHHAMPDIYAAMRPVIGTLLLQHESSFAEPLDGPLWYLPAILIMHVTIDLCRKTRYQHCIMITLCIVSFFLYAANKYWYFAPGLTPMGVMRNLPYYYLGYVMGQHHLFREIKPWRDFAGCILCFSASILIFVWHLQAYFSGQHLLHIVLYYPVNIGFLFGVLYGCKCLNSTHSKVVVSISNGTLVIIGLHIVLITIFNYVFGHILASNSAICYQWYEALPISLFIVAFLYPVILWGKRHAPVIIGKKLSKLLVKDCNSIVSKTD